MGVYRLLLFVWSVLFCVASVLSSFDVNDILSVPMMPVSWLVMDNQPVATHHDHDYEVVAGGRINNNSSRMREVKLDGSFDIAYSTMGFHRKMIKEYMCSNFLASNILNEVAPSHFQQRMGLVSNETNVSEKMSGNNDGDKLVNAMKFDQGSKGYQDWLSKTTTLDDIYRHYLSGNTSSKSGNTSINHRRYASSRRQDKPVHEDYDEGDVTGYAMQMPIDNLGGLNSYHNPQQSAYNHHQGYESFPTADSKSVYPYSHGAFDPPSNGFYQETSFSQPNGFPIIDQNYYQTYTPSSKFMSMMKKIWFYVNPFNLFSEHVPSHPYYPNSIGYEYPSHGSEVHAGGSFKEMGLKDLFDIALTTLAFLSFGMFILQVLMCITMSRSDNSNMMMLPMEEVIDENVEGNRKRRSTTGNGNSGISLLFMNELTKTILMSIDAVEMAEHDHGKCLRYAQCESNKMSRDLNNSQKIWIPVWNLGLSWLASRVIITQPKASSILESLKASAYGLGRADCSKTYACSKKYQIKDRKK